MKLSFTLGLWVISMATQIMIYLDQKSQNSQTSVQVNRILHNFTDNARVELSRLAQDSRKEVVRRLEGLEKLLMEERMRTRDKREAIGNMSKEEFE